MDLLAGRSYRIVAFTPPRQAPACAGLLDLPHGYRWPPSVAPCLPVRDCGHVEIEPIEASKA